MSLNVEVKIDVILHATESQEKIFDSFKENFGLKEENFKIKNLTGHFDNPITIISTNLKKKDAVSFISNILKTISKTEFNEIYDSIDENITSSGLKLKINKQKMIQGKVMLEKKDAVKINISCPIYVKKDSKKIYRQILEL
jgi:RNA binding exosome subunit|tara:strand:+ start:167 stop:589 length:423 start_codon:yes stop_codon:yes gene_type:complete